MDCILTPPQGCAGTCIQKRGGRVGAAYPACTDAGLNHSSAFTVLQCTQLQCLHLEGGGRRIGSLNHTQLRNCIYRTAWDTQDPPYLPLLAPFCDREYGPGDCNCSEVSPFTCTLSRRSLSSDVLSFM